MLYVPGLSKFSFEYNNWPADPGIAPAGTSIVPGASNAEGSWTQVASSANISRDIYWMYIVVSNGGVNNTARNHLLDIGVDPAGGTSYSEIISNIVCGQADLTSSGGKFFLFPFFIKAGSSIAVRIQGSHATAGTVHVACKFYGDPSNPENVPTGMVSETIGTITNSNGVSFTPGNAADGTWVSLGTTSRPLWWWQLGYQIDNSTITPEITYIDIAYGDGTNKHIITRTFMGGSSTENSGDVFTGNLCFPSLYCPLPAGAELFIRGRCNNAPDTGYNGVAIGVGG